MGTAADFLGKVGISISEQSQVRPAVLVEIGGQHLDRKPAKLHLNAGVKCAVRLSVADLEFALVMQRDSNILAAIAVEVVGKH